ncbi:hypothetical protein [Caballeronia sp.]|uniref:hypothetical protein n=1 Tax=Caballeronia sp. TaxID=1931223 RepID=UPI003C602ABC
MSKFAIWKPRHRVSMAATAETALTTHLSDFASTSVPFCGTKTLELMFSRPVSANVRWADIEALFLELGATVMEREGSRIAVVLFGQVQVYHRPHPWPTTDKGAIASIRKWLESNGVKP